METRFHSQRHIIVEGHLETEAGPDGQSTIIAKEVARKIKSFEHFMYVWGEKARYYLPPKSALSWGYIAKILSGEKRLLKLDLVGYQIDLPRAKGFHVRTVWERCKGVNGIGKCLPEVSDAKHIPRKYFYNVELEGAESSHPRRFSIDFERF
jgi:hypothetical protein